MNLTPKEIIDYLKTQTFEFSPVFTRSFSASPNAFPRVVVVQLDKSTDVATVKDVYTRALSYQVEIYAQDMSTEDGSVVNRLDVSESISEQIEDALFEQYKMNCDETQEDSSYSVDTTRRIIRFSCFIDRYGYTYRQN